MSTTTSSSDAPRVEHPGVDERAALGKGARKRVPRAAHGAWEPAADRPDPVALIASQETTRVEELLPIRHERMLVSPFTFYRGAAIVMASDLATQPDSGLRVQACGDAHLANFGGFLSPDRQMVFDMNDFDETAPAPFEWDVKRLATSFTLAARDIGADDKTIRAITAASVRSYRETMRQFAEWGNLDVWYARLDVQGVLDRWSTQVSKADIERFQRNVAKAEGKNSLKAFAKLTTEVDGTPQIVNDPPLVVPLRDLAEPDLAHALADWLHTRFRIYRRSLAGDRRRLVESYELRDFARKVVGVGSVGTRCWIALMTGRDDQDPLFLKIKEANESVLEPYAGRSGFANHGQRVVEGQRLLQASSDITLGWMRTEGLDGVERDYYVRQLWDGKLSPNFETAGPPQLMVFAEMCGWTLARGHARSGDRVAIAAYLGSGDTFDRAITEFAVAYADQNERDYAAVAEAVKDGRLAS